MPEPVFRDFGGEQNRKPPGLFDRTHFYYFPVRGDVARLTSYVQRIFGVDGGPKYEVPYPWVLLAFTHVERLHSDHDDLGSICYKDIALWIPVRRPDNGSVLLFPGYMFVDNGSTMATGREMFGFPKQMGKFQMPTDGSFESAFTASCSGRVAAADIESMMEIFRVAPRGGVIGDVTDALKPLLNPSPSAGGLLGAIEGAVRDGLKSIVDDLLHDIPPSFLEMLPASLALGLQQCRDPQSPVNALHQAIVETTIQIAKVYTFKAAAAPGDFQLTELASHPIRADLGIDNQPVHLGLYFLADSVIAEGKVVWRAP